MQQQGLVNLSGAVKSGPLAFSSPMMIADVTITDVEMKSIFTTPVVIIPPSVTQGKMIVPVWLGSRATFANVGVTPVNGTYRYIGTATAVFIATLVAFAAGNRETSQSATVFNTQDVAPELPGLGIELVGSANASAAYATVGGFKTKIAFFLVG
jgi:hypothetical protein